MKYLTLIRAIALLHQYQRPVKTAEHLGEAIRYIEVTREDIATAHRLAHDVLGRSLDELPPQTRRLLGLIEELVAEGAQKLGVDRSDFRFSRRQVRERTGWGDTQLRVHLGRLVELELVLAHRGRQGQSFLYELLAQTGASGPSLSGLLDAETLSGGSVTAATSRGAGVTPRGDEGDFAGGVRGASGVHAGGAQGAEWRLNQQNNGAIRDRKNERDQNKPIRGRESASVVALPTAARDAAPTVATAAARG
jgi:DNA primase